MNNSKQVVDDAIKSINTCVKISIIDIEKSISAAEYLIMEGEYGRIDEYRLKKDFLISKLNKIKE